jgi:hypothetical protein
LKIGVYTEEAPYAFEGRAFDVHMGRQNIGKWELWQAPEVEICMLMMPIVFEAMMILNLIVALQHLSYLLLLLMPVHKLNCSISKKQCGTPVFLE